MAGETEASKALSRSWREPGGQEGDARLKRGLGASHKDAFSATASAASPLTRAFHSSSIPLRRPLRVSLKPMGVIVITQG